MRKQKKKRTSPLFYELAEIENDSWWREKIFEIAEGYFPPHLNYANSTFYYKNQGRGSKNLILVFDPNIEQYEMLKQLKTFLRDVVGLIPDDEVSYISEQVNVAVDWNFLKKKKPFREILIWNYLKSLGLSRSEFEKQRRLIFWGFVYDEWNEKTFKIENGQIVNFDPNQRNLIKKTPVISNKTVSGTVKTTIPTSEYLPSF